MGLDTIRQEVTTKVEEIKATFTAYPLIIEYDNKLIVDTATQENPFLCCRVKLLDGYQRDYCDNPYHTIIGQIELAAAVKDGAGSAKANQLLDFFYPKLHRKSFGGVRTKMALPAPVQKHNGWHYYAVLIPLWTDQQT